MGTPETASILRERIDDLTTRLLIGDLIGNADGPERLLAELSELGRQARETGYGEAASITGELSAQVAAALDTEALHSSLHEGLSRLQQAIENAGQPDPAAAAPSPVAPAASSALADDPELIADFVVESREHLTSIEQMLLTLEKDPSNADAIHSVFRGFHTIKGVAGFLEFASIHETAHDVETALNQARDGKLAITPAVIDVVLESVDYLNRAISAVETGGSAGQIATDPALLARVRGLIESAATPQPTVSTELPHGVPAPAPQAEAAAPAEPKPEAVAPADAKPEPTEAAEPKREATAPLEPKREAAPAAAADGEHKKAPAADTLSVRVDTGKLDYLVDMVGEMVIAQSLVHHNPAVASLADPSLTRDLTQLARITGEVQRTAMAMRMIPIGQVFHRVARQIRDLSRKLGKQANMVTRGEDTELDKTIAEELADPLMHMARNSIDHGIESPEVREAAGKPAQATITLAAYHQGGQIVIEVGDDGRGLDCQKILAKAREKGIIEDGSKLSEAEIYRLILEPGFSTAERVTGISGRGVGMDVVRKQVEKLRGRIEIRSRAGVGTTFLLKLPLTLAIIDGLVVTVGGDRYIVPLFAVTEMFRPAADAVFTVQGKEEMVLVRGHLLPMLRLHRRFGLKPRTEDPCEALLIVAEAEGKQFCLMVDDMIGKQEVVIKSLGEALGKVPGIAGGAILGDGRVGLIVDVGGLWAGHAGS